MQPKLWIRVQNYWTSPARALSLWRQRKTAVTYNEGLLFLSTCRFRSSKAPGSTAQHSFAECTDTVLVRAELLTAPTTKTIKPQLADLEIQRHRSCWRRCCCKIREGPLPVSGSPSSGNPLGLGGSFRRRPHQSRRHRRDWDLGCDVGEVSRRHQRRCRRRRRRCRLTSRFGASCLIPRKKIDRASHS